MTPAEKDQLVHRLQAGKRKAKAERPRRLAELERAMDDLGTAYKGAVLRGDYAMMADIRRDLRPLGDKRLALKWGE